MMVHVRHVRQAKLCMSGARQWFEAHNLSWTEFVRNGYPIEVIEGTGDPLGLKVGAIVREEAANGRRR